jgi:hypothetical protein
MRLPLLHPVGHNASVDAGFMRIIFLQKIQTKPLEVGIQDDEKIYLKKLFLDSI